ncbi:MAG: TIGR03545 family protein [Pirellulaceae bacterium]
MLRWSYVLPRLLFVVAGWLLLRYGLDPLLQRGLQATGEAALGAKVEIDAVETSLRGMSIALHHVQAADPSQPMQNLIEFDRATLDLDGRALMKRRYVVHQATINGIAFHTPRATSGALAPREPEDDSTGIDFSAALDPLKQHGAEWFESMGEKLAADLESQFRSIAVAKELARRWPEEYGQMEQRVELAEQRVRRIRDAVEELKANPLRNLEFYQQQIADLEALRREVPEFRNELERLVAQVKVDRRSIIEAKEHDEQKIRDALQAGPPNPQELTEYLLGNELIDQLNDLRKWLSRGRSVATAVGKAPELNAESGRGLDFNFAAQPEPPSMLVRHVAFDGRMPWRNGELLFTGQAQGLTHQPRRHGRPAIAHFRTEGEIEADVWLLADYTSDKPIERLLVNCPNINAPARHFGQTEKVALGVPRGSGQLWMQLDLRDEQMNGRVVWKQDRLSLEPQVGDRFGGEHVNRLLTRAVSDVDHLHVQVHLSGELRRPRVRLESNLGPELASGLNAAAQQELIERRDQLLAMADKKLAEETAKLDAIIESQRQRLQAKIDDAEQRLVAQRDELMRKVGFDRLSQLAGIPGLENLNLPNVDLGQMNLPQMRIPNMNVPKIQVPQMQVPPMQVPQLPPAKELGQGLFGGENSLPKWMR